jgi:hypothetical protein
MREPAGSLADHHAWMERIGSKPCTCTHGVRTSREYGPEWVRLDTNKDCLEHGQKAR